MARIAGIDIPNEKPIKVALTYIYGIGPSTSKQILGTANIDLEKRVKDLGDTEVTKLNSVIDQNYQVEGELRQKVFRDIKRLKDIRAYRGVRHKVGLPARGQNTRTNAVTRKGRSIAVGGLKRKLDKK